MKVTYFSSGEFARLCGTTKETLRHYHNIGLLVPARTTENGYHYYASFQFYDYYFISSFKGTSLSLKDLQQRLEGSDEHAFRDTLQHQLDEIRREQEDLAKKEKLLRRTLEKFEYLYEGDAIGQVRLYDMEEEYFIATPVHGNAGSDRIWLETIRSHLSYCSSHHLNQEYQLTYCWLEGEMLAGKENDGWSICSQIASPVDDLHLLRKPKGTYACILLRDYDFSTAQYDLLKEKIAAMGLSICGNAYESDVSLFSTAMKDSYLTEISVMVK